VKKLAVFTLLLAVNVHSADIFAEELLLPASRDNTLFEDAAGRFSNGSGQYLFVGRTGVDNGLDNLARRSLLYFDLGEILPGSRVLSAALSLTIDRVPPDATGGTALIYRVASAWGEGSSDPFGPEGQGAAAQPGDATWIHTFFDTATWLSAGGDFAESPSASADFGNGPQALVFESSAALIADLQAWVDDPEQNNGWIVIGDEIASMNARRLLSRENSSAGSPVLQIEFEPPMIVPLPVPVLTLGWQALLILLVSLVVSARSHSMFGAVSNNHCSNRDNRN
jgi:hypothetical protein